MQLDWFPLGWVTADAAVFVKREPSPLQSEVHPVRVANDLGVVGEVIGNPVDAPPKLNQLERHVLAEPAVEEELRWLVRLLA